LITSPLLNSSKSIKMDKKKFNRLAEKLDLFQKTVIQSSQSKKMNLVFILLESSHCKYLSLFNGRDETQPLLKKYKNRMELFCNFYSTYPDSMHARFSCFNSLYSPKEYITYVNPNIKCPSIFEILSQNGYTNSMFYSSFRTYTRFADYLANRKLDEFYDFTNMPHREKYPIFAWGVDEKASLSAISDKIENYSKIKEPFFLTYIPAAPHYPYDYKDPRFNKFNTKSSNQLLGRYKNDLLFMDWIQYKIINKLQECKLLDNTLIIITSDHGERLAENGLVGHGWELTPELCHIPLIIINPKNKGYKLNYIPGTQVDLLKTILDLLDINTPENIIFQGTSLYKCSQNRNLYFTSGNEAALLKENKFYRKQKIKKGNALEVYTISHTDHKTEFSIPSLVIDPEINDLLKDFDLFQESLILNYSYYLKLFQKKKILQFIQ
ncbi:sulfatase-like hydrolase/transferase, partial [bacterium]|nr:sulfatase-like hydrolase/transferase [bacterium]